MHGMVRCGSEQRSRHHEGHRLRLLHGYVLLWGCDNGALYLWILCFVFFALFFSFLASFRGRDGTGTSNRRKRYTADQVYYFILQKTSLQTKGHGGRIDGKE